MGKTLLGKLAAAAVGMMELPRLAPGIVAGFRALGDLTGTVSDALDECSIAGVALLRPTDPKARMVGQAITVENRRLEALSRNSGLADIEAHNLADPGDVLVIQGVAGISSMGGISAAIGKRQGESGAVVDGAVRDIDRSRALRALRARRRSAGEGKTDRAVREASPGEACRRHAAFRVRCAAEEIKQSLFCRLAGLQFPASPSPRGGEPQ